MENNRYQDGTEQEQYWYNLKTGQVEKGVQSKVDDRMGPYPTQQQAQNALESAQLRNEKWDDDDAQWDDDKE